MAKKPPDKELGKRIRYLREKVLKIDSQEKFADLLGVSRGAVGNWELGQGIKTENLRKIAKSRVSFEWLATGTGKKPVDGDAMPVQPSEAGFPWKFWEALTADQQKMITKFIESFDEVKAPVNAKPEKLGTPGILDPDETFVAPKLPPGRTDKKPHVPRK